jgi:hypothetical protein
MALSYTSFVTPTANVAPTLQGTTFNAPFNNSATFSGDTHLGEYRQYVKGTFSVNGSTLAHLLCGTTYMSAANYLEDGCPPNVCTAYGYRSCPQHPYNQFLPLPRSTGAQFAMYDAPGLSNVTAGSTYAINLSFRGQLINTSTRAVLVTNDWTAQGSTTVPQNTPKTAPVALAAADKIVGVHRAFNTSGAAELHLVIARPPGRPPLDPASITLTLIDAAGGRSIPSQSPAVHEFGNKRQATASFVYLLDAGADAPVSVELILRGSVLIMAVKHK